jgi:hypothetical protein
LLPGRGPANALRGPGRADGNIETASLDPGTAEDSGVVDESRPEADGNETPEGLRDDPTADSDEDEPMES